MFQELMPLLGQRILVLTLARINTDEICVNVIPKPLKSGDKDESNALSTPLSVTGTPTELDQELPKQLVEFVAAHLELSSTLQNAKAEMATAARSARDASRKSAAAGISTPTRPAASQAAATAVTVATSNEASQAVAEVPSAPAATTGSLFEAASGVEC